MATKFVFVTGGVVSSLGKGITAASLGRLLKARGYKVSMQKLDPYINAQPGLMSPYQHGELFVTDDGAECDLDLGHYERFIDENLSARSTITSGKIYWHVLSKERQGAYNGGTVQVIPHITDEIKRCILAMTEDGSDIVITEIGGTVGDMEGAPFLEAIRQLGWEVGPDNICYIHVTLLPYLYANGELKTKPTQHSVKELRSIGIQPDVLVCRSEQPIPMGLKEKIALFCNLRPGNVVANLNVESLYEVPLKLEEEGLARAVLRKFKMEERTPDLEGWRDVVTRYRNPLHTVTIGMVGKYTELQDAYLSNIEALTHGGIHNQASVRVKWIAAESVTDETVKELLGEVDAIYLPGGFGTRGIEGMIEAIRYAREKQIPFLGVGLGMQLAAVEFARNVLGLTHANSTEVYPETPYPIVGAPVQQQRQLSDGQVQMRLGRYACQLRPGSIAECVYGESLVHERHRHRFELHPKFFEQFEANGLHLTGTNPEHGFAEVLELDNALHPWFVAALYQPEFRSRPNRAHPLYSGLIEAAIQRKEG